METKYHILFAINVLALIYLSILAFIVGEGFNAVFGGVGGAFVALLWILSKEVKYA